MLFGELLIEKFNTLTPHFEQLFNLAIKNQTHPGDFLLVMENAWLSMEKDFDNGKDLKAFYNIGMDIDGHCQSTNYDFILQYVNGTPDLKYQDYLTKINYSSDRSEEIEELTFVEGITIQVEMLIYLKIWEGETFLKKWYQLMKLVNGEDYDWHLSIRGFGKIEYGSLSRYEMLKYIKEKLQIHVPELYESFTKAHRSQLRNAIAHSQYAILGRNIMLNNFDESKAASIGGLSFDDWIDIFHETIELFNHYTKLFKRVRKHYFDGSLHVKKKAEVRVNRKHPTANHFFTVLYTRDFFEDWSPYPNP